MLITFEGLDYSGKTTIIKLLEKNLKNKYDILVTREPGGSKIGEKIRNIILDKNNKNLDSWTEALLFIASRKQHLEEKIIPALKDGKIVLCDRFIDSTIAYQGAGRQLPTNKLELIQNTVLSKTPNLTLYLDVEIETLKNRMKNHNINKLNRLDLEDEDFFLKVKNEYFKILKNNKNRVKKIDANQEIDKVFEDCYKVLTKVLFESFGKIPRGK